MALGKTITIRTPKDDPSAYEDYLRFKELVTKQLGSDVCYTTISLYRAFLNAMEQNAKPQEPIEIKFWRQNVQINMGCTFQYYTKKARRTPQDDTSVISDKHNLLPDIVEQYPTMNQKAQDFWIDELRKQGWKLEDPHTQTSSGKSEGIINKKLNQLRSIVRHCKTLARRLWNRLVTYSG